MKNAPTEIPGRSAALGASALSQPSFLGLAPESAVPLYRQIAVALRYRIATGELGRGDRLPSLREAAEAWGVNYHTVRRAYGELEESGLVERRRGAGTTVTSRGLVTSGAVPDAGLREFLAEIRQAGSERFGLSVDELALLLTRPPAEGDRDRVVVVECNAHQCRDLAEQIRGGFAATVEEWLLERSGEPPEGAIVGTYFHYGEMRRRWPRRRHEMYFPTVHPDPGLRERLATFVRADAPIPLPLCEREPALAEAMARDASVILPPDRFAVTPVVDGDPAGLLARTPGPVLFAPRVWDELDPESRADGRALELRYVFRMAELAAVAEELGWRSAAADPARG